MFGTTWADKSVWVKNEVASVINEYIKSEKLPYQVKETMSGFNDRIIVLPVEESYPYCMASLIIGWWNADAELAVIRWNGKEEKELFTSEVLTYKNDESLISEGREYLLEKDIKHYPSPFDKKSNEFKEDIISFLNHIKSKEERN